MYLYLHLRNIATMFHQQKNRCVSAVFFVWLRRQALLRSKFQEIDEDGAPDEETVTVRSRSVVVEPTGKIDDF